MPDSFPTLPQDIIDQRYRGIGYPITKRPGGYFDAVYTRELIRASIRLILLTRLGERVMLPTFGSSLPRAVFEANDELTLQLVKQSVDDALRRWEPRIKIRSVDLRKEEDLIQAYVSYTIIAQSFDDVTNISFPNTSQ